MAAAIPFFKVGVLLVKQATKPMARALKARATSSERLSRLCAFMGQQWHLQTTRLNLMVQGHRVKGVKPLNDQEAVQSGAEIMTESFVLGVGVAALVAESKRSARAAAEKAAQKEARRHAKQEALDQKIMHVTDLVREAITYQIILKEAMEKQTGKPLPPVPNPLHDLMKPAPPVEVFKTNEKHEEVPTWKRVLPQLSTSGITAVVKWIGAQVSGEDGDGDDDDDDGDGSGDGGDDDGDD